MQLLKRQLLNLERIDLAATAERLGDAFPQLHEAAQKPYRRGRRTVLEHTQEALDALLHSALEPPQPASGITAPWWWPMPAAYAATLFHDLGRSGRTREPESDEPHPDEDHPRSSAEIARDVMFRLRIPFEVREHAVSLILHHTTAERNQALQAADSKILALACALDTQALYLMRKANYADLKGTHVEERLALLEGFRDRCASLGAFGRPPDAPLDKAVFDRLGVAEPSRVFLFANTLRYFRIVEDKSDPEWLAGRLADMRKSPSGRLNLLVGAAGCGKSVWAAEHLQNALIVSTDQLREQLTGDAADQRMNDVVFERCMEQIGQAVAKGQTVTFDATNRNAESRAMPVRCARWRHARIVAYYFDVPCETVLQRNRSRPRQVPEETVLRQYRELTVPALYECDELVVVDSEGKPQRYWPLASFDSAP